MLVDPCGAHLVCYCWGGKEGRLLMRMVPSGLQLSEREGVGCLLIWMVPSDLQLSERDGEVFVNSGSANWFAIDRERR